MEVYLAGRNYENLFYSQFVVHDFALYRPATAAGCELDTCEKNKTCLGKAYRACTI
jgi:hypothetical protein